MLADTSEESSIEKSTDPAGDQKRSGKLKRYLKEFQANGRQPYCVPFVSKSLKVEDGIACLFFVSKGCGS